MSKKPRLLLPAEQEMYAAARYDELQAPGLGHDFLEKIKLALKDISASPERWPIVRDNIRRRLIHRFPFSLLYKVDTDEIIVVAVMHQKRHPAYWLPRRD